MGFLKKLFGNTNKKAQDSNAGIVKDATNEDALRFKNTCYIPKSSVKSALKYEPPVYFSLDVNKKNLEIIKHECVVFDVETTGLNSSNERIIEIGAAYYKDGNKVKEFSSLVNIHSHIPESASKVNNITDDMIATAPEPKEVYSRLAEFLGEDVLKGEVAIVGYNVTFDMNFLCAEFNRVHISATLRCLDVMKLAKMHLRLDSYKQTCVAEFLNINTGNAHRALDDVITCANIFFALADKEEPQRAEARKGGYTNNVYILNENDLEYCAVIDKILKDNNISSPYLRYKKFSDGAISANVLYKFIYIKRNTKGTYIVLPKDVSLTDKFTVTAATKTEGGDEKIRAFFSSPLDLFDISSLVVERFIEHDKYRNDYMRHSKHATKEAEELIDEMYLLSDNVASEALARANTKEYPPVQLTKPRTEPVKKEKTKIKESENKESAEEKKKPKPDKPAVPLTTPSDTTPGGKRPICQLDDDGNVIQEFESIAEAVKVTGVNSKSIRDAAKGVQKHAGGYVWRYM